MAVRTATKENRQAAAKGQKRAKKKRAHPRRLHTLGIMASRIRKHRRTCLKAYRLMFRRDIFRAAVRRNPGPDTQGAERRRRHSPPLIQHRPDDQFVRRRVVTRLS
ncbi:hypothetical protein [Burkholderia cenocepacia]|uniref:hypothetical protein n=1 Tax=Burkholderia cenocepacia TaxID=95486 RepID=UPI0016271632|nr:hypothetical protein [Burkholderia cenocepacia]